jgi:methionine synthase II (cobalamin-independent)
VPLVLLRNTGVKAVSLDITLLTPKGWESVAATVESGVELWAGVVPTDETRTKVTDMINPLIEAWRRVGLPLADLSNVTLTPACGLATLSPSGARKVQRLAVDAGRALTETAGS